MTLCCCYVECCYAECLYAQYHYAECRHAECCYADFCHAECSVKLAASNKWVGITMPTKSALTYFTTDSVEKKKV